MKIIICGGRDLDRLQAFDALNRNLIIELAHASGCSSMLKIDLVVHGGCRGADEGAEDWAKSENIPVIARRADWKKHGKAAGPIRNREMLTIHQPDYVVALPGGRGTENMISQAESAGIPVVRLEVW